MIRTILLTLSLLGSLMLSAADIKIDIPHSLMGRDYIVAARVESVTRPFTIGKTRVNEGLRVYNPQLVRMALRGDTVVVTALDAKRGPQQTALPIVGSGASGVTVVMDTLFTSLLRGVDVMTGRHAAERIVPGRTRIEAVRGDASHLEVSVSYAWRTDRDTVTVRERKSLLLLSTEGMKPLPASPLIGYKSSNGKHIDRYDLSGGREIVFNVSDRFPQLWQEAIREGVEDWNAAFALLGRPHAVKARLMSEAEKDFDPYDIRSNCIFMIDSDFENAQGNHWTDPRTGEIIQSEVLLYTSVMEKLKTWLLTQTGAYNQDVADGTVPERVMKRILRYAVAHEIGHCLGLEHNYRASYAYDTDSLRSESFCKAHGTTPSIMDYARFNYIAQPSDGVVSVYPPLLGAYDTYAIEAGYGQWESNEEYLSFIASRQHSPLYAYRKRSVSALPTDIDTQPTDLGNDAVKASRYGIANIGRLPASVLEHLDSDDVYAFYFQLLGHLIPSLDKTEARKMMEEELNEGYRVLLSEKMESVYGDRREHVEQMRAAFIRSISRRYELDIKRDPESAGLWMPHQMVKDDIFSLLKADGMKLTKKDITDINRRCLSGAALSLSTQNGVASPFASASFVSKDGLVMTNFHCVSTFVQRLAKGENDYMRYGCWATKREEEAPLFGLEAHQVLSVDDVTELVFKGTEGMDDTERDKQADKQARELMRGGSDGYGIERKVYSLNGGQQYVMVKYRTFSDLRIVACPPMWLGAYGGDEDNWTWPRYSCDFAFLRVYVAPDGSPVDYDKANVPFRTKSYLKVSRREPQVGDMSMVIGFPSRTRKNIPAFALDKIVNRDTQLRARMLKAKIDFLNTMKKDAKGTQRSGYDVRIAKLNNVYLRSKGEIDGVSASALVEMKQKEDKRLQDWINADKEREARYGRHLTAAMDSVYGLLTKFNHEEEAFNQFAGSGAGIIPLAGKFEKLIAMDRSKRKSRAGDMKHEIGEVRRNIREFFPSISMTEDCGMMKALLPIYTREVRREYLPEGLKGKVNMDSLYAHSLLTDSTRLERFLDRCIENGTQELADDALYRICIDIFKIRVQKQFRASAPLKRHNTRLYGLYMRAKHEMDSTATRPYDANHTLRFSTGRVMERNSMADMLERKDYLPQRFRSMMEAGKLPLACFITNAETAAGNSGSPVVNARGELIGLNFDRTAASAASIYRHDPLSMRNIAVSMDYILWVVRNWSQSQYILKELGVK